MTHDPEEELFIVGVGASAGGLEALTYMLSPIKGKENCCIVILQHLNPAYTSKLKPLLQRNCAWKVEEIQNNMRPEPSAVYVTPPKMDVSFQDGHFHLKKITKERIAPCIDHFFGDLAAAKRFMAIGVILSGTGHDGTAGIEMIRKNGG
jgi:two-component system CheB/CheR fusion protein